MPWRTNRVAFETQLSDIIRCSSVLRSGSLAILSQLQFWLWQIGFRHSLSPSEIRIPGLQTKENPKPMCKMWDMPAPDSVKNIAGLGFNNIHQSDTNRRSPRCTYPDDSWLGTLTRTATRQNRSHCLWSEACVQCWYASHIYTYTYSRSVQTKDNYNATIPATILACAPL